MRESPKIIVSSFFKLCSLFFFFLYCFLGFLLSEEASAAPITTTARLRKPLSAPVVISPLDASVKSSNRVKLRWKKVKRARKYQVKVIGGGRTRKSKWVARTSIRFKVPKANEAYSWMVRAKAGKRVSPWCESNVFYVKKECVVSLSPNPLTFSYKKESKFVEVKTLNDRECLWKISCPVSWLSPDIYQEEGSGGFWIKAYINLEAESRSGTITVGDKTLTIKQDGKGIADDWDFFFKYSTSSSNTRAKLTVYSPYDDSAPKCFLESVPGASYSFKYQGTWINNDSNVTLTFESSGVEAVYSGTVADSLNYMSGTISNTLGKSGTWYAIREGTTITK